MSSIFITSYLIFQRELSSYFATPIAYVFIAIFLLLSSLFTFYLGNFFELGQASLSSFFEWHPWLYLFLIPSITMRLWAEEKKNRYYWIHHHDTFKDIFYCNWKVFSSMDIFYNSTLAYFSIMDNCKLLRSAR